MHVHGANVRRTDYLGSFGTAWRGGPMVSTCTWVSPRFRWSSTHWPRVGQGSIALTLYCCSLNPGCYNTTNVNGEHVMRGANDMPPSESLAAPSRYTPQTQPAQKWNHQYMALLSKVTTKPNQTRQTIKYENGDAP